MLFGCFEREPLRRAHPGIRATAILETDILQDPVAGYTKQYRNAAFARQDKSSLLSFDAILPRKPLQRAYSGRVI